MPPLWGLDLGSMLMLLIGLTVAVVVTGRLLHGALRTARPRGIVPLELAGTPERAQEIIDAWRAQRLLPVARRSVVADSFFFVPAYSACLAALGVLAARAAVDADVVSRSNGHQLGTGLFWLAVAAGGLDLIENFFLLRILPRPPRRPKSKALAIVMRRFRVEPRVVSKPQAIGRWPTRLASAAAGAKFTLALSVLGISGVFLLVSAFCD